MHQWVDVTCRDSEYEEEICLSLYCGCRLRRRRPIVLSAEAVSWFEIKARNAGAWEYLET